MKDEDRRALYMPVDNETQELLISVSCDLKGESQDFYGKNGRKQTIIDPPDWMDVGSWIFRNYGIVIREDKHENLFDYSLTCIDEDFYFDRHYAALFQKPSDAIKDATKQALRIIRDEILKIKPSSNRNE